MQRTATRNNIATGHLGGASVLVALLLTSEAVALCPSFPTAASFPAGYQPRSVAVADFDGDGVPDLVTASPLSDQVSVLLGNGDGSFQTANAFAAGGRAASVAAADLNGDGIPDLVTADSAQRRVGVMLGNGDGSFQTANAFEVGGRPASVAVADLDGDGIPDLVANNTGSPPVDPRGVSVLLGTGDGYFQPAVFFELDFQPTAMAVADLDGDGSFDLVTSNYPGRDASVMLGNGDGSFKVPVAFSVGNRPFSIAVADLDGDGFLDLATGGVDDFANSGVRVLLGNGDGTFQTPALRAAGRYPMHIIAADLDADGVPDLVTTEDFNDNVSVLRGNGDGSFEVPVFYNAGRSPESVVAADLDGDGVPDLVTANPGEFPMGYVRVLLGNGDGTFHATVSVLAGVAPGAVAVADLDRDSVPDLVTANYLSRDVSALLGNGGGTFQPAASFDVGPQPRSVAVADLDGDAIPDLAVAYKDFGRQNGVDVLLGNGDGTFQAAIRFAEGLSPNAVALADLDGDDVIDLVTAGGGIIAVLLGNGDGTFRDADFFPAGSNPIIVAIADLDGDGILDAVTANNSGHDVSVLLGNGDGSFQPAIAFAAGTNPTSVAVADLDGDLNPDLAVSNYRSDDVSVLLGNGDGTFRDAVAFAAGFGPNSVAAGDLDGDGVPDLVSADSAQRQVSVLLGNGDGSFQTAAAFAVGFTPSSVVVADVDGNRAPDIVTGNLGGFDATILFNQCVPPAPAIDLDIKPGSDSNTVNPSHNGVIPVAILGSDGFDVAIVDTTTLAFGPGGAPLAHRSGPHFKDVNGDGRTDLLAHFRVRASGIGFGDVEACIRGQMSDGTLFGGCDAVRTVPAVGGDERRGAEAESENATP